jgi:integrase family protein with SAM-like domain
MVGLFDRARLLQPSAHNRGLSRIRDVSDHFLVWGVGCEVAVDQVGDRLCAAVVLGQTCPPRPRLARHQALVTHDGADQLEAGRDVPAATLEEQVHVQRVAMPASPVESWTVLGDDDVPIEPIERYLAYLTDIERSPNTIKAYAHDLKDYWVFLAHQGLDWREVMVR